MKNYKPTPRRVRHRKIKAEGCINGLPYNTDLLSADGVEFLVWIGEMPEADWERLAPDIERLARSHRDVVRFVWCPGEPTGFWARSDIPAPT